MNDPTKNGPSKYDPETHRAMVLAAAEAAALATAQILKDAEQRFLFALAAFKQAIEAEAHAKTTLDFVRISQEGGVQ